ncbi:MAG: TetR/AcrR family transcriptional regulator [Parvibaculaceae bacterium]|nr:TetR/AcrR family transcriptional regulator [Parvibaculaceae bacterium]
MTNLQRGYRSLANEGQISTRQRLLDVALELFAQHGFSGASMRMLARAAGLRESSIYNHFSSKNGLYTAVLEQWGPAEFVERLKSEEYQDLKDDPRAFFRLCGTHLIDRWMDPREHLFMAMVLKESPQSESQQHYKQALFHDEIEILADYCRHFTVAHGMIAPDPVETSRMFVSGLVQIRRQYFSDPTEAPTQEKVALAVKRYIENFIATVFFRL